MTVYTAKRIYLESEDLDPNASSFFYRLWELTKLMNFPEFQLQWCAETGSYWLWEPIMNTSSQSPVQWCYISRLKLSMMGVFLSRKLANIINQGSSHPDKSVVKHFQYTTGLNNGLLNNYEWLLSSLYPCVCVVCSFILFIHLFFIFCIQMIYMVSVFLSLTYFTLHNILKVHSCCRKWQE